MLLKFQVIFDNSVFNESLGDSEDTVRNFFYTVNKYFDQFISSVVADDTESDHNII